MNGAVRNHRWLRILVPSLALLLLCVFIGCRIVGAIFRAKLAASVKKDLGADLVVGSIIYRPPYTFLARDVRLVRHDPTGGSFELLQAEGLDITLDGLSQKSGPIPVRQIVLGRPAIRLKPGGVPLDVERLQLSLKPGARSGYECLLTIKDPAVCVQAFGTLDPQTGLCEVQNFSLAGRMRYIADSIPWPARAKQKIADADFDGEVSISGTASMPLRDFRRATYQFMVDISDASTKVPPWKRSFDHGDGRFRVRTGSPTENVSGWLPIETSIDRLDFSAGTARIRLGGGKFIAAPAAQTWRLTEVAGSIDMGSELLTNLERSGWFFEKDKFQGPLEFTAAASGPFHVPAGKSPFEAIQHELLAYAHGISMQPRKFSAPLTNITGGPIAFRGGVVIFKNIAGSYGLDKILLHSGRLVLEDPTRGIKLDDLRQRVKFEELDGTVVFHQPGVSYPGAIGKVIAQLRPTGSFVVGGGSWCALDRPLKGDPIQKPRPDFFIRLIGDGGTFAVTRFQLPLTDIHGQATIVPLMVDIPHFDARSLGGTVWAAGRIVPGKPFLYEGKIEPRDINLRQLATALSLPEPARSRLAGVGYMSLKLAGTGKGGKRPPSEELVADGELEILRGDFWSVPAVQEVASSQGRTPEQLGIGDAAALFHIANRTITLQNAAVNSPLLGLQGTGTIGFDKTIFLTIIAAPLGDWRDRMRQAKIPIVGDILGAVQQLLNTVQGALLYQFRVTGTLAHPVKSVIPAPVITDPIALLFGQMLRQDQNGQLLNDVKGKGPSSAPTAQVPRPTAR